MGICSDDSKVIAYSPKCSAGVSPYGRDMSSPNLPPESITANLKSQPGVESIPGKTCKRRQDSFVQKSG